MAGEFKLDCSSELRAAGCMYDGTAAGTAPVVINVEDECKMENGQCCFDLRFSFAYQTPPMQVNIPTLLTPDVGWPLGVSIDANGLAHYCIDCEATCFTVIVYNWDADPYRYDCYEFDSSPCN